MKNKIKSMLMVLLALTLSQVEVSGQYVENRNCPDSYFRNNGNGQYVTDFASNIDVNSTYYQSALSSGNQGNLTFKWGENVINPPVINKTWLTSTEGVTAQDWIFGNNSSGTPFNPPGIPSGTDVQYTFYNNNLPTAGSISIEFIDPYNGSVVNTCSYPLSKGATSSESLADIAVVPPSDFYYAVDTGYTELGSSGKSVKPNINSGGGSVTYSLISADDGITIDANTGEILWDNSLAIGTYDVTVNASNGLSPDVTADYTIVITEVGVSSGGEGGLESESIGSALAEREFSKYEKSEVNVVKYAQANLYQIKSVSRGADNIQNYLPNPKILGASCKAYTTSPKDLLSFTNAEEVVSVDYTLNGVNKAVAFCVQTSNGYYTHTKPVCDRLKGSELIKVEVVNVNGFQFIQYTLQPKDKHIEYAVSFVVGVNNNDEFATLQSKWLTASIDKADVMYNFQLWSADPDLLLTMVKSVVSKLEVDFELQQTEATNQPRAYFSKAQRSNHDQWNLNLTVKNDSPHAKAKLIVKTKSNEQSNYSSVNEIFLALKPKGITKVAVPLLDIAEAEIELWVNGEVVDFIYSNDGVWNIYATPSTTIEEFSISNDRFSPDTDSYRLYRNIKLQATTSDYVTVYKMLRGNGMPVDLSKHQFLSFSAIGEGSVRVRIIKSSIDNYEDQYAHYLRLEEGKERYEIDLDQFYSPLIDGNLDLTDVAIVSFTFEANNNLTFVEVALSDVQFSPYTKSVFAEKQTLKIFPNPAVELFTMAFKSPVNETARLQLINVATGNVAVDKQITVQEGENLMQFVSRNLAQGVYVIRIQTTQNTYREKVTVLKSR